MVTRIQLLIASAVALLFLVSVNPAFSTVIHVPADQLSIQEGIDVAASGDTVLVAAGTYFEIIEMKGGISLRSETGRADCVTIDAGRLSGVIQLRSLSGPCLLEGFTITGGINHGLDFYESEVVVRNCLITVNSSWFGGGGVNCRDAYVSFFDCVISNNHASYYGGGIYVRGSSQLEMTNCRVIGNSARLTGGGLVTTTPGYFLECTFEGNNSRTNGGGIWSLGQQTYDRCLIKNNYAKMDGGGVFVAESNVSVEGSLFTQCVISDNIASEGRGGGICIEGRPRFENCKIWGNSASVGSGGGISCSGSPTMTECEIAENFAGRDGGGMHCVSPDSAVVTHCSFVGNSAVRQGGGIYAYSSHLQLTFSIIAFSKEGEGILCYGDNSQLIVSSCDIYGNEGGDQLCGIDTGSNFSEDPLFCDMASGNYFLDQDSPCLIGADPYYFAIGANGLGDCSVAPVDDPVHAVSGALGQNHPNPFNPITTIPFTLLESGRPVIRIFDVAGRQVKTLLQGVQYDAGPGQVTWTGRDDSGNVLPSGVYFYRLEVQDFIETRRMVLMK